LLALVFVGVVWGTPLIETEIDPMVAETDRVSIALPQEPEIATEMLVAVPEAVDSAAVNDPDLRDIAGLAIGDETAKEMSQAPVHVTLQRRFNWLPGGGLLNLLCATAGIFMLGLAGIAMVEQWRVRLQRPPFR